MGAAQLGLLGKEPPRFDERFSGVVRTALDAHSFVEHGPGFLRGHQTVFDALLATLAWRHERRDMYDRVVEVPRLLAAIPDDGPGHPVLEHIADALSRRYGHPFRHVTVALYRDGEDSVAWHGDRIGPDEEKPVVTVSLGAPRRFLMREVVTTGERGRRLAFHLGWGDLFVMGGACQSTWQHAVPKQGRADPRMAVMFR